MRKDAHLSEMNSELIRRRQSLKGGGGPRRIEAQHAKGKGTARERIDALLDTINQESGQNLSDIETGD